MRALPLVAATFTLVLLPLWWTAPAASSHELLPSEIVDLMRENPDLTVDQIDAFLDEQQKQAAIKKVEQIQSANDPNAGIGSMMVNFLSLGVQHILEGLDHVLFVLSLLLVFVSLRKTLKLVTAFTVAHSITFLVAGTGLLTLSPRLVEPLIALSIAYVAVTTVFFARHPFFGAGSNKTASVFFFGLFHGLGFAGLLTDLNVPDNHFLLALVSFNVGIELGQLMIITAALPFIYLLRKYAWYSTAIKVVAVGISGLAFFWAFQRIFG